MKKRYIVLSGLLAVTLAACSQEQPKNEENTQKTEHIFVQDTSFLFM